MKKLLSCITALSLLSLSTVSTSIVSASNIEPTEIVSMRSEYEKHFDNGDGTMTAYINTVPLHYLENGEWVEYDNSLKLDKNGNYTNLKNPLSITVPSKINTNSDKEQDYASVKLVNNGHTISISLDSIFDGSKADCIQASISEKKYQNEKLPAAAENSFKKTVSSVVYTSAQEQKELELAIHPYSLIETLSFDNSRDISETLKYFVQADDLVAEKDKDGNVNFSDANGSLAFTVISPVITDSSEDPRYVSVSIDIDSYDNGYYLTLTPDEAINELVSPLTMSTEYTVQRNAYTFFNSQATPGATMYYSDLRIGNITGNGYQSFITCNESFTGFNDNSTITDAKFNMYLVDQYLAQQKQLKVYSINTSSQSCTWTSGSTLDSDNTFITDFYVTSTDMNFWKEVDVTTLVQSWLNNAKTSQLAGVSYHGFKIVTDSTPRATVIANSERASTNHPYFEITYVVNSDYTSTYAPYKYNDIVSNSSSGLGSIYNFQSRMNCYAYALQIYNGNNNTYQLVPGSIGLMENGFDYTLYQLRNDYYACSSISAFMNFTEQQMMNDSIEMGTNLSRITLANDEQFVLPSTYNESTSRIIAMNAALRYYDVPYPTAPVVPPYDYHFYLRHGNGTCPIHNDGVCSMWSHKLAGQEVSNSINGNMLCDHNIATVAKTLTTVNSYGETSSYSQTLRFYTIEQDMNIYDSWYIFSNEQVPLLYIN